MVVIPILMYIVFCTSWWKHGDKIWLNAPKEFTPRVFSIPFRYIMIVIPLWPSNDVWRHWTRPWPHAWLVQAINIVARWLFRLKQRKRQKSALPTLCDWNPPWPVVCHHKCPVINSTTSLCGNSICKRLGIPSSNYHTIRWMVCFIGF